MNVYQLLCGMTAFISAILYATFCKIYTPTTEPGNRYKIRKGKKGKPRRGAVAPAPQKIKPANPLPPQSPSSHISPPASASGSNSGTSSEHTIKDSGRLDASVTLAPANRTSVAQMPLSSPSPSPASRDDTASGPAGPGVDHEAAKAYMAILSMSSPRKVSMTSAIPLSEARTLFELVEQDKSEESVGIPTVPNQTQTQVSQLTPPSQTLLKMGLRRLRNCLERDLRIDPGVLRTAALLTIIWNIHFAMAPEYSLPLKNTGANRFINSREIAAVFLNRYGTILWPDESEPAPHLIDRSLKFSRYSTVDPARYYEWMALGHAHPKKGSLTDLQVSKLGIRMTKFVGFVYDLPIKKSAGVDWSAVSLVLDDEGVREETLGGRFEDLPGELRRQVLRMD